MLEIDLMHFLSLIFVVSPRRSCFPFGDIKDDLPTGLTFIFYIIMGRIVQYDLIFTMKYNTSVTAVVKFSYQAQKDLFLLLSSFLFFYDSGLSISIITFFSWAYKSQCCYWISDFRVLLKRIRCVFRSGQSWSIFEAISWFSKCLFDWGCTRHICHWTSWSGMWLIAEKIILEVWLFHTHRWH